MFDIAIVDDEFIFLKQFKDNLNEFFSNCDFRLDLFQSSEDFLNQSHNYDFVFLDIDMPNIDGITLAKKRVVHHISEKIVFVTNKEALVFDAYNKTASIGFIRKSHLKVDLCDVINTMRRISRIKKSFAITKGAQIINLVCDEILYFEKKKNNIIVHTINDEITYRGTMKSLEKELGRYGFIKTHEGFIVNVTHIYLIGSAEVILSNQARIPISRKNVRRVKEELLKSVGDDYA